MTPGLRASLLIAAAVALATAAVTILIRPAGYGRAYVQAMLAGAAADATLELTPSNERTP